MHCRGLIAVYFNKWPLYSKVTIYLGDARFGILNLTAAALTSTPLRASTPGSGATGRGGRAARHAPGLGGRGRGREGVRSARARITQLYLKSIQVKAGLTNSKPCIA
jgi:hypothetical protein